MIDHIEEPYKGKVLEILNSNSDRDILLQKLKLYVLSEPYFKKLHTEPTWVAYEIVRKLK